MDLAEDLQGFKAIGAQAARVDLFTAVLSAVRIPHRLETLITQTS